MLQDGSGVQCCSHTNQAISLPVTLALFGDKGMQVAGLCIGSMVFVQTVCSILTYQFMGKDRSFSCSIIVKKLSHNPSILAISLGLIVTWVGIPIPNVLNNFVTILNNMFLPVLLLTVGVHLANTSHQALRESIKTSCMAVLHKLVFVPVLFGLVGMAMGVGTDTLLIITTNGAAPSAIICGVYAAQLGGNPRYTSTITSLCHGLCPFSYAIWSYVVAYVQAL